MTARTNGRKSGAGGESDARPEGDVAVVKKYANRRLYNTATSSYVTLDELSLMVRQGTEFVVYDAKSGDDITRSVLTQIILEEDSKGRNLLPIGFLRQLISFYDDSLHALVPRYLEVSMENFSRHQDQMRSYVEETFGRFFPMKGMDGMGPFDELTRQNLAMMQNAARMLSPFTDLPKDPPVADKASAPSEPTENRISGDMKALRDQLSDLQRQIDQLSKERGG